MNKFLIKFEWGYKVFNALLKETAKYMRKERDVEGQLKMWIL